MNSDCYVYVYCQAIVSSFDSTSAIAAGHVSRAFHHHQTDRVNNALDLLEHQIQSPRLVPHGSHLLLILGRYPTTHQNTFHHISHRKHSNTQIMADVEMMDAPVKTSKGGADTAVDGKKRFEVKKVRRS